jgi:hypothetical protein
VKRCRLGCSAHDRAEARAQRVPTTGWPELARPALAPTGSSVSRETLPARLFDVRRGGRVSGVRNGLPGVTRPAEAPARTGRVLHVNAVAGRLVSVRPDGRRAAGVPAGWDRTTGLGHRMRGRVGWDGRVFHVKRRRRFRPLGLAGAALDGPGAFMCTAVASGAAMDPTTAEQDSRDGEARRSVSRETHVGRLVAADSDMGRRCGSAERLTGNVDRSVSDGGGGGRHEPVRAFHVKPSKADAARRRSLPRATPGGCAGVGRARRGARAGCFT